MFFGTWTDAQGVFFDTAHFADCLQKYPFQGGGCYLLLGTVEVDYHFPALTISKMPLKAPQDKFPEDLLLKAAYRSPTKGNEQICSSIVVPWR